MISPKDLVDISDKNYNARASEFMQCQNCKETLGGTRGDYWYMSQDEYFVCPECNSQKIALVSSKTITTIIKQ